MAFRFLFCLFFCVFFKLFRLVLRQSLETQSMRIENDAYRKSLKGAPSAFQNFSNGK